MPAPELGESLATEHGSELFNSYCSRTETQLNSLWMALMLLMNYYCTVSQKNRTPATFCNNSNGPGSIAIDFDKNNR